MVLYTVFNIQFSSLSIKLDFQFIVFLPLITVMKSIFRFIKMDIEIIVNDYIS